MSHIKNIEIKNFKSIRHQKIEDCRRVNVFIGYPNVGKSNILEALGLYSALTLRLQTFKFNQICRVKHFSELYFNQDSRQTNNVIINDKFFAELIVNDANDLEVRINDLHDKDQNNIYKNLLGTTVSAKDYSFGIYDEPNLEYYRKFAGVVKKYEFQKDVIFNAKRPKALAVPNGNNLLDSLLGNAVLRKDVAEIFRDYNLKLNIDLVDETLKLQKDVSDGFIVSIPYHQIADTLRRLIFFKAAIQTNENSVLLFEEPEAHMFPPYVSKFTTDIIFDENDNQFFIATHSPVVINDFMEELKYDQLSVYAVGYNKDVGETIVRRLSDAELNEIYQYGVDLFFNLEDYLKHAVS